MLTALVPLCLSHPLEWSFTPCPLAFLEYITNLCNATVVQHPEIIIVSPAVAANVDNAVSADKGESKDETDALKVKRMPKVTV